MNNTHLNRFFLYFFGIFLVVFTTHCTKEKIIILSDEKEILEFEIQGLSHILRQEGELLHILLFEPLDSSRSYIPLITVSEFASIYPPSGQPQLFSYTNNIKYTVTAQSGNKKDFFVKIHETLITDKTILNFTIPNKSVRVLFDEQKIQIEVYHDVDITSLVPIITIPSGATISPASGDAVDFTNPVIYTVTAQDGSMASYTVTVTKGLSKKAYIESFELVGTEQIFERDAENLFIYVPYETDITNIKTNISISEKASISPESGVSIDFTNPQEYTVTSSDGTIREYTVTVKKSPWRKVGNGPFSPRDDIALIELNGKLFMFRGWINSNPYPLYSREVWATEDGITWIKALAEVPWEESIEFKNYISFAKFKNQIWAFGAGKNGDETWNTSDGINWSFVDNTSILASWGRRYWPYIGEFNNKLFVIGGINWWDEAGNYVRGFIGAGTYNDVWTSDDGINWEQERTFSHFSPRGVIGGFVNLNNTMFIIGGGFSLGVVFTVYHDVFSSSDGLGWSIVTNDTPWGGTAYHTATVHDGRIYLVTGNLDNESLSNQTWYSSDGATWTQVKHSFFPKRHAAGLVSFKGKLWLVAGYGLNDIWCYNPDL